MSNPNPGLIPPSIPVPTPTQTPAVQKGSFNCRACSATFSSWDELQEHRQKDHPEE